MPHEIVDVPLSPTTIGTRRSVRMFRFGPPDARPKAYIQAALHADETPGILVAHHLLRQLQAAEARGEITGQVVVVPCANPIGLGQYIHGEQSGRFELASGANFNRGWADRCDAVAERVRGRLGDDGRENARAVRQAMRAVLDDAAPARELDALHLALAREACDVIRAPFAGVVTYHAALGQRVSRGDSIVDIVDPSSGTPDEARRTVRSGTHGVVLSRRLRKLVCAGEVIAKIAGIEPLAHRRGYLLED